MKTLYKNILAVILCVCLLSSNAYIVEAAKKITLTAVTFDAEYYYNTYADLQTAIGFDYNGLLDHYLTYGMMEGRSGSAQFNCMSYRARYQDLKTAFGSNLLAYCIHYETYGLNEGRDALYDKTVIEQADAWMGEVKGSYTTTYDADIPRAINVSLAAARINGVVLQPGDSFSFSKTILPRTTSNGYVSAPVISAGQLVPGMGGGICQVSSTLYAAMVAAELPATERHQHSLVVDYVPRELDATIAGTVKDLKFVNIFEYPIQIKASADNGTLTVSICK